MQDGIVKLREFGGVRAEDDGLASHGERLPSCDPREPRFGATRAAPGAGVEGLRAAAAAAAAGPTPLTPPSPSVISISPRKIDDLR